MEPSLLKSLKLLRETKQLLTRKDLAGRIKEDEIYVRKALEKLVERKIIAKSGRFYRYEQTSANEEFFRRMQAVYEKALKRPKMELIVRGLLSNAEQPSPYAYYRNIGVLTRDGFAVPHLFRLKALVRLLEDEGFDSGEIHAFLKEEMANGWVGKFEFYLGSEERISLSVPSYIPFYRFWFRGGSRLSSYGGTRKTELVVIYHGKGISSLAAYLSKLKEMSSEEVEAYKREFKERWKNLGWFIQQEQYLLGEYPFELAHPAREYLDKQRPEIRRKISDEASHW